MKPLDIETRSFSIIDIEAGEHGFSPPEWQIVRRMIHTTADFDYLRTVRFHPDAVAAGIRAIRSGKPILTDTEMARSGIRKKELALFNVNVSCLITDPQVTVRAERNGITRARAAVDASASRMTGGIYVIGNAPTALLRLLELIEQKSVEPALIIGLPVGFVNASESKDLLARSAIPHITNIGRKGGSAPAASVINALSILAVQSECHPSCDSKAI